MRASRSRSTSRRCRLPLQRSVRRGSRLELERAALSGAPLVGSARKRVRGRQVVNKEILMVVDAVSNEKGVDKEVIFEALEAALASAPARNTGRSGMRACRSIACVATK